MPLRSIESGAPRTKSMSIKSLLRRKEKDIKTSPNSSTSSTSKALPSKAASIPSSPPSPFSPPPILNSPKTLPSTPPSPSTPTKMPSSSSHHQLYRQPAAPQYTLIDQIPRTYAAPITTSPDGRPQTIIYAGNCRSYLATNMYRPRAKPKTLPRGWKRTADPKEPPVFQLSAPGTSRFKRVDSGVELCKQTSAASGASAESGLSVLAELGEVPGCDYSSSLESEPSILQEVEGMTMVQRYSLPADLEGLTRKAEGVRISDPAVAQV